MADAVTKKIKTVAEERARKNEEAAKKKREKLEEKIMKALTLQGDANTLGERLNTKYWDDFVSGVTEAAAVKCVRKNVNILMSFYGL